jgi:hypothetical protein
MKTSRGFLSSFAIGLLLALCAWTTAYGQITPSQDAYTNTATPTTNLGTKTVLDVESGSQTTYIQFDLSSIPAGYTSASIAKATLKLYVNAVTAAGSFNVDYVNGTWSEKTITASVAPALGTTLVSSVPLTSANVHDYVLIDITPAVGAWLDGTEPNDGIALVGSSPLNASFDSKENTTNSHSAELDIVFAGGGTISGVTTAGGSGLTGGGTSGTLNLGLTNTCAANQVLQWNGSSWACAAVGTGTITGVTAGPGLLGGGLSGNVALSLDTTKVPLLGAANTFTGTQNVASGDVSLSSGDLDLPQTNATTGAITMGGKPFAHACCSAAQNNTFFGVTAGNLSTTGATNTAEGFQAMFSNTNGCCNVANGTQALFSNTAGCCNVASGQAALNQNTVGTNNTADGYQSLFNNTSGSFNTAVGIDSMVWSTTGSGNVAVGNGAGNPSNQGAFTGSNNTFVGIIANPGTQLALNNASAIGAYAQVTESNAMVLGSIAGVNGAPATANVGIGTTAPAFTLDVHGTGNFTGPITFASGQAFPGTITGVNTASGSGLSGSVSGGTLNLGLTNACAATQVLQWTGSAWACSAAGSGTITGVTAGADLTGGGTSGNVTVNLDTTKVPLLAAPNTFLATQTILGGNLAVVNNNSFKPMLVQSSSGFGTWLQLANTDTGGQTWNFLSAGPTNAEGAGNLGITNLNGGTIWLEGPIHGTSTVRVDGPATAGGVAASFGGNGDFSIDAPGVIGGRLVVKDTSGFVGINDNAPVHPLSVVDTKTAVAIEATTEIAAQAYGISGIATDRTHNTAGVRGVNYSSNNDGAAILADNDGGSGGNLFLGRNLLTHEFRVDTSGNVFATQYITGGADFAESFAVVGTRSLYEAGDLLVIDDKSDRRLSLASEPYSSLVAGIFATKPGVLATPHHMDDPELAKEIPLAVVGIVPCKVTAENGAIRRGDLLVTSSIAGYAMKGTDRTRMLGAVVGKALEPLASGKGTIQVLVTLQ